MISVLLRKQLYGEIKTESRSNSRFEMLTQFGNFHIKVFKRSAKFVIPEKEYI